MTNLIAMYRSSDGRIQTLAGWEMWARDYYKQLAACANSEYKGSLEEVMLPLDWFERIQKRIGLTRVGAN